MRIGFFTDQYYPCISGVVTSVKMLYEGLTSLGHECYIFTSFDENMVTNQEELNSKNVINIYGRPYPFKGLKDYRYTFTHKKGLKIVKQYNLDIIHIHTEYNMGKLAIKASKKFNIPMVHTLHTLWCDYLQYLSPFFSKHFKKQMLYLLKKWFTGPVSKQSLIDIVPSEKAKIEGKIYGLSNDTRVIPTGIELEIFNPKNYSIDDINTLKEKLGIKPNQFVFLYLGRVSPEKKIPTLLSAYAKACKDNDDAVFLLVGGGPDLKNIKNQAKELGIDKHIIFTDIIPWEEIGIYYQLGDIFVNASQSETQGLTYIEALASSTPLLVQKDDCILNVIENFYNGIYFDGEEDLVLKMKEMLKAPETLKKIKANTLKSVEQYSKESYAKKILSIYEEAIEIHKK